MYISTPAKLKKNSALPLRKPDFTHDPWSANGNGKKIVLDI